MIKNVIKRKLLCYFLAGALAVSFIGNVPSAKVYAEEIGGGRRYMANVYLTAIMIHRMLTVGTIWDVLIHLGKLHLKYGHQKHLRLYSADMRKAMVATL